MGEKTLPEKIEWPILGYLERTINGSQKCKMCHKTSTATTKATTSKQHRLVVNVLLIPFPDWNAKQARTVGGADGSHRAEN